MAIFRLQRSGGGSRLNGTAQDRVRSGSPGTPYPGAVTLTAANATAAGGNEVTAGGAYRVVTVQYRTGGEYLDLYIPKGPPPAGGWPVVQFGHSGSFYQGARGIGGGNGFTTGQRDALIAAGYALADCDYTLTGEPQVFSQQGLTHPVGMWSYKAAGAWLRDTGAPRWGLNASKMLATGYSAGGHIAFESALTEGDTTARSYPDNADGDRSYGWRAALTLPLKSPFVTTDPTYAGVFMWSAPISATLEYGVSAGASAAVESLVGHTLGEAVYQTEADLNSYISSDNDTFYGTTTHYPDFPVGYSWTTSDGLLTSTGAIDALYTVMGEVGVARPAVGTITSTGLTRFHVAADHASALSSASISDFIAWANAALNPITGAVTLSAANATAAGASGTVAAAGTSSSPGTATPSAANATAAGATTHVASDARLTAANAVAAGATSHVGTDVRLTAATASAVGATSHVGADVRLTAADAAATAVSTYGGGTYGGSTYNGTYAQAGTPSAAGAVTPAAANATAEGAATHVGTDARLSAAAAVAAGAASHVASDARLTAAAAVAAGASNTTAVGGTSIPGTFTTTAAPATAAGATAHVALDARLSAAAAVAAGATNIVATGGSNIPGSATPAAANATAGTGPIGVGTGVVLTAAATIAAGAPNTSAVGGEGSTPGTVTTTAANATAAGGAPGVGTGVRLSAANADAVGGVPTVIGGIVTNPGFVVVVAALAVAVANEARVPRRVPVTAAVATAVGGDSSVDYQFNSRRVPGIRRPDWTHTSRRPDSGHTTPRP